MPQARGFLSPFVQAHRSEALLAVSQQRATGVAMRLSAGCSCPRRATVWKNSRRYSSLEYHGPFLISFVFPWLTALAKPRTPTSPRRRRRRRRHGEHLHHQVDGLQTQCPSRIFLTLSCPSINSAHASYPLCRPRWRHPSVLDEQLQSLKRLSL